MTWQRAVTMVVTGLIAHAYVEHLERGPHGMATKKAVLARDKRTCIYCGRPGTTIDHLQPQSRGGRNRWLNMAACCHSCNNRKADRTPEEAGMKVRWDPWRPDVTGSGRAWSPSSRDRPAVSRRDGRPITSL